MSGPDLHVFTLKKLGFFQFFVVKKNFKKSFKKKVKKFFIKKYYVTF